MLKFLGGDYAAAAATPIIKNKIIPQLHQCNNQK
jgi:hypothetical protein